MIEAGEPPAASRRVLVVDDERAILLLVRRVLLEAGLEADMASSPEEALRLLREREYDLVLLDVIIPSCAVEDTVRRIREKRPRIGVLLMTGGASQAEIEGARGMGAVGPVLKPFDPKALVETVQGLL